MANLSTQTNKNVKTDIQNRQDIDHLMRHFYQYLLADSRINYLFTNIAQVNLEEHFPVLCDFWEGILFQSGTYKRNAMQPHLDLHKKSELTTQHFSIWLAYFNQSINELFVGEKANYAKERALSIATVMQIKIASNA